jgi:hypothetical protein
MIHEIVHAGAKVDFTIGDTVLLKNSNLELED